MTPIYQPTGRAGEYAPLAVNIYAGCNHGCAYCYAAKNFRRWHPHDDFTRVVLRPGIVEAVKAQLTTSGMRDKTIMLCFTCDPYPAPPVDTTPTREIIKVIKDSGNHVQILTKGGLQAERDFDLLDSGDWFGVTYAGYPNILDGVSEHEPMAAAPRTRLLSLQKAHRCRIKTWVSCEPVLGVGDVQCLIENADYIDLFKIGKLNYHPSDINWGVFGRECERLCQQYGRNYYIKEDLRKEMGDRH